MDIQESSRSKYVTRKLELCGWYRRIDIVQVHGLSATKAKGWFVGALPSYDQPFEYAHGGAQSVFSCCTKSETSSRSHQPLVVQLDSI